MYAGGVLVTVARLRWDASTYVPVRELWPALYLFSLPVLAVLGVALLVLVHLAVAIAVAVIVPDLLKIVQLLIYLVCYCNNKYI